LGPPYSVAEEKGPPGQEVEEVNPETHVPPRKIARCGQDDQGGEKTWCFAEVRACGVQKNHSQEYTQYVDHPRMIEGNKLPTPLCTAKGKRPPKFDRGGQVKPPLHLNNGKTTLRSKNIGAKGTRVRSNVVFQPNPRQPAREVLFAHQGLRKGGGQLSTKKAAKGRRRKDQPGLDLARSIRRIVLSPGQILAGVSGVSSSNSRVVKRPREVR